jgi:hypothetical protein
MTNKLSSEQTGVNRQLCPGLTLGTVLQVQVEGLGSVMTSLVGMAEGLHLIIKTPPLPEIATKLYVKNIIIVRYFHAGQVFGFRATLMSLIKEPFRLCILSYPTSVEIINLRKHDRIYCMIPAEIKLPGGFYGGLVEDISVGGCSFELNTPADGKFPPLKIGEEVLIILDLPGNPRKVVINIVIRTMKMDSQTMKLGAQFLKSFSDGADADPHAAISEYIAAFQKND